MRLLQSVSTLTRLHQPGPVPFLPPLTGSATVAKAVTPSQQEIRFALNTLNERYLFNKKHSDREANWFSSRPSNSREICEGRDVPVLCLLASRDVLSGRFIRLVFTACYSRGEEEARRGRRLKFLL